MVKGAKRPTLVRTGDATPYSNIDPRAGMALAGLPRSSHTDRRVGASLMTTWVIPTDNFMRGHN